MTERMLRRKFFMCRNFVSSLICTLKSKKPQKTLNYLNKQKTLKNFQNPRSGRVTKRSVVITGGLTIKGGKVLRLY